VILFGSIKGRLIAMHVIAMVAAAVVLPLALYWRVDTTARELHERALREQAQQIAGYLHRGADGTWALDLPEGLRHLYSVNYDRYGFAVLAGAGQVLFSSRAPNQPLFPEPSPADHPTYGERDVGKSRFFDASVPVTVDAQPLWVQISQDQAHRDVLIDDIVADFLPHVAWVIVPILLGLLGIDLLIFRKALHPLEEASALAQKIGPTRTDIRLPEARMPRDVLPLVRAVNEALQRLEHGFTVQQEFVADAAHELRTPLAILRAEVEALADRQAAGELLSDIAGMTRIVNQLIETAEFDRLTIRPGDVADISAVCIDVAAFMAPVAVAQGRSIAVAGASEPVWVEGNAGALFQAVRNLVENAVTHTASATTVEIAAQRDGTIVVSDAGPGIPAGQHELIFQRFWRSDRRRAGSAGLGLAIVARIVSAHGGSIAVRNGAARGAVFTMQLRPIAHGTLAQEPAAPLAVLQNSA
jgi:signal transduction histidine kinase